MTRYLIIDKEMGVFLGTHLRFALFAASALGFDVVKAISFDTEKEANDYVKEKFSLDENDYFIAQIKSNNRYIHVIDIIKSGYGDYAHYLMNNMQMISYHVH